MPAADIMSPSAAGVGCTAACVPLAGEALGIPDMPHGPVRARPSPFEALACMPLSCSASLAPGSKAKRALSVATGCDAAMPNDLPGHVVKERRSSINVPDEPFSPPAQPAPAAARAAPVRAGTDAAARLWDADALIASAARKPASGYAGASSVGGQVHGAAVDRVLAKYGATPLQSGCTTAIGGAAIAHIASKRPTDTFYIYDLGEVARLYAQWRAALPRVVPYFAVKCNPEPAVMELLNALGAGFDCASVQELERAAALGVPQSRIIFANPCKRPADFRYAARHGVRYTTFDCASELHKIAEQYPAFQCVLRIRCDDDSAKINLGLKYGADPEDAPALLELARELGLTVVGVSFHVGSGCANVGIYADAIAAARDAFDAATRLGFRMELLDIGGGFTAPYDEANAALFSATIVTVNAALAEHFPPNCGVRIIAEPGRYFAETSATLFTTILGQRTTLLPGAAAPSAISAAAGAAAPVLSDPSSVDASSGDVCAAASLASASDCIAAASEGGCSIDSSAPFASSGGSVVSESGLSTASCADSATWHEFRDYWLSDGTYGSFRILVTVDGLEPNYSVLRSPLLPVPGADDDCATPARLWGNSERQIDCVQKEALLPRLRDGDWLMFPYAGAYTICAASNYGGVRMAAPEKVYVFSVRAHAEDGVSSVCQPPPAAQAPAALNAAAGDMQARVANGIAADARAPPGSDAVHVEPAAACSG